VLEEKCLLNSVGRRVSFKQCWKKSVLKKTNRDGHLGIEFFLNFVTARRQYREPYEKKGLRV